MAHFLVANEHLRARLDDAIVALRLGAAANGVSSMMDLLSRERRPGELGRRDVLQLLLVGASYTKEAIDLYNEHEPTVQRLADLAREAGFDPTNTFESDTQSLSKEEGSSYRTFLRELRNKMGFHLDEKFFRKWILENQDGAGARPIHADDLRRPDRVFLASQDILAQHLVSGFDSHSDWMLFGPGRHAEWPNVGQRLIDTQMAFIRVAQVAMAGLVASTGRPLVDMFWFDENDDRSVGHDLGAKVLATVRGIVRDLEPGDSS